MRYSWLSDDCYIYFRYADNFVNLGSGLVFNRGEFVEGFSSPLWMITLICLRYFHINFWIIIKLMAVISLIACWVLLILLNRKLSGKISKTAVINFPMIHLMFSYGVLSNFTSGLESSFTQLCGIAYATFLLYPNSIALQVIVGLSPLVRHELAVPYIIVFGWYVFTQKKTPVFLLASCVVTTGLWLMFRTYYYAELLPNTFYLKDEVSIRQGIYYVLDTIIPYGFHYILIFFILCFLIVRMKTRGIHLFTSQRMLMLCAGLSITAYVIKIGGAPVHYRYLAFPYCVIICATGGLLEHMTAVLKIHRHAKTLFLLCLLIMVITVMRYPDRLIDTHPFFDDKDMSHHHNNNNIGDASAPRVFWGLTPPQWGSGSEIEFSEGMKSFHKYYGASFYRDVLATTTCSHAHRKFDYQVIHGFGLTEPFLARTNMFTDGPAHKRGLIPMSEEIAKIRRKYGFHKGAFRKALEDKDCPNWVQENIDVIERIELKVYNRHRFLENIRLTFMKVGRISP